MTIDIGARIDSSYGVLSPQEKRAADFILDHLDDLAVFTSTELAERSGVSKATVSRLFRSLGFTNAQEVREHARGLRSRGAPIGPVGGAGSGPGSAAEITAHLEHEVENLRRMLLVVEDGRLDEAADLVAASHEVVVIGRRNSHPVAMHLRQQLAQSRARVRLAPAPGQTLGGEIVGLGAGDAVVLVGFRRRPTGFERLVLALHERGVPVVLIADAQARRHAEHTTVWLECPVDSAAPFDSYAAAMSLVNLLATRVLASRLREGRERIAAISGVYALLDEVEERS